jgi:hypothetical protein
VKPSEAADKAMTASATQRMRGLLRSMPPTMTLPTRDAVGRRSSVLSEMKHESIQLRTSANRSSRACNRRTISGKFSSGIVVAGLAKLAVADDNVIRGHDGGRAAAANERGWRPCAVLALAQINEAGAGYAPHIRVKRAGPAWYAGIHNIERLAENNRPS